MSAVTPTFQQPTIDKTRDIVRSTRSERLEPRRFSKERDEKALRLGIARQTMFVARHELASEASVEDERPSSASKDPGSSETSRSPSVFKPRSSIDSGVLWVAGGSEGHVVVRHHRQTRLQLAAHHA